MATLVHDVQSTVVESAGDRAAQFTQFIPQSFVDDLKERRKQSDAAPIGELLHAATIPTFVVERWMREGFNIYSPEVTGPQIIARLEREGLDYFKGTSRRI
jgi:hypothetical protein